MFAKIFVPLSRDERDALSRSAATDIRGLNDQARYLLRRQLEQQGLLKQEKDITALREEERARVNERGGESENSSKP